MFAHQPKSALVLSNPAGFWKSATAKYPDEKADRFLGPTGE
jgi:hypothetical protein